MDSYEHGSRFTTILDRMIAALEAENNALLERRPYNAGEIQAKKTMALFELERLGSPIPAEAAPLSERVACLRRLLEVNQSLLRSNVLALRELVDVLRARDLSEESDGTYSVRSISGPGQK